MARIERIDGTRPRAGLGKVGKMRKNRRDAAPRRVREGWQG